MIFSNSTFRYFGGDDNTVDSLTTGDVGAFFTSGVDVDAEQVETIIKIEIETIQVENILSVSVNTDQDTKSSSIEWGLVSKYTAMAKSSGILEHSFPMLPGSVNSDFEHIFSTVTEEALIF